MTDVSDGPLPVPVRVRLAHAVVQAVADQVGADLLHVKGPAIDRSLRHRDLEGEPRPRLSTDADVIVRPAHVRVLMRGLEKNGWEVKAKFSTGSVFEHAASLWHAYLGYTDVHRTFPGVELSASEAFGVLWADRGEIELAGRRCAVPSLAAQRLLLVLHAAREGGVNHPDVRWAWTLATEAERHEVTELVGRLHADVGFAAGTGHLDEFTGDPSYSLWAGFQGEPRDPVREWRARIRAANNPLAALRILGKSLLVNRDHLAMRLGHRPTPTELVAEYRSRSAQAVARAGQFLRRRLRGGS